jgi:hypothetical protein
MRFAARKIDPAPVSGKLDSPRNRLPLRFCLGLLWLTRAALVLACSDVFFYGEELGKGTAAKALLDGLPVPWIHRNYGYHEGGGFVVTHLKALAFLAVGENVLAHKLVALLTTSLILAAGWRLSREHFGERAAAAFGLLFVLSPAPELTFSLLCLGTHFEALLFIALVLHLALRIGKVDGRRLGDLFALGFSAGFGLYFSLLTLPASACAALWVVLRRRARLIGKEALAALLGLALGALPLVWTLAQIGMLALKPAPQTARPRTGIADAAGDLVRAFAGAGLLGKLTTVSILVLGSIAILKRRSARLVAAWLALYLVLYLASGLATENTSWFYFLRLVPFWFGGLVLLGAGFEIAVERSKLAWGVPAVLALLGLVDLGAMIGDGRPRALGENVRLLARTQGYDYSEYLDKFLEHLPRDDGFRVSVVKHFREDPRTLAPELARSLLGRPTRELPEVVEGWRQAWGEGWELGLTGFGVAVDPSYGHDLERGFLRIEAQAETLRPPLAESLGRIALGLKYDEEKLRAAASFPVPSDLRAAFLRGGGWRLYKLHRLRPDRARAFLETLSPDARADFERGWSEAAATYSLRRAPG